jgi:hypothetical protein
VELEEVKAEVAGLGEEPGREPGPEEVGGDDDVDREERIRRAEAANSSFEAIHAAARLHRAQSSIPEQPPNLIREGREVRLDNAPDHLVRDRRVSMNEAVPECDDSLLSEISSDSSGAI